MIDLAEKQRIRAINDRRTYLINELYKLGVYQTRNQKFTDLSLTELEQIHINEKCRKSMGIVRLYD